MDKIIIFVLGVCVINTVVYYIFPYPELLILNKEKCINQPWRFITYQFQHTSQKHLFENIIGLFLVGFIARDIDISFNNFVLTYFISIFVVIPFVLFVFPTNTVAGNSTGIYGILSFSLIKGRRFVPLRITLPLFTLIIFLSPILNFINAGKMIIKQFQSSLYHFIGFISGIILYHLPKKKKIRILH